MKCNMKGKTLAKSVREDIYAEFRRLLDRYNYEAACQILHILHFEFGWGKKRLQRFAESLTQMQKEQKEWYELEDEDTPWICAEQLRKDGIYIDEIVNGGNNAN